jgi:hypothetical protein
MFAIDFYVGWKFDLAVAGVLIPVFAFYVWPWLDRHMSKYADGEVFEAPPHTGYLSDDLSVPDGMGAPVMIGEPWYASLYSEAPQIAVPGQQGDEGSYVRAALHDWKTNGWL